MNELIKETKDLVNNGEKQLNQIDNILGGENKPEPPLLDKHIEEFDLWFAGTFTLGIVADEDMRKRIIKFILKVKEDTRKSGYDEGYKKGLEDGEGYQRMSNAIENNKCH